MALSSACSFRRGQAGLAIRTAGHLLIVDLLRYLVGLETDWPSVLIAVVTSDDARRLLPQLVVAASEVIGVVGAHG